VLLVTGRQGVGKTMVFRRVAVGSRETRLRGFFTKETREQGERKGFWLIRFDGEDGVIAHVGSPKAHRVSKYGVHLTVIDGAASLLAHDPAAQLSLVDETGMTECLSVRYVTAMWKLLAGDTPVVTTAGQRYVIWRGNGRMVLTDSSSDRGRRCAGQGGQAGRLRSAPISSPA